MNRFGVLALQGDFEAHERMLRGLGVETVDVRRPRQLEGLEGLVLPGGESTTLLNLMRDEPWFDALRGFHRDGGALLATCAGTILISREVQEPSQPSLGLLDAAIRRNGYGRQVDSFEAPLDIVGFERPLHAFFIRAPRIIAVGPEVEVLARLEEQPVLVRQGRILAGTFHPELTDDSRLHRMFVDLATGGGAFARDDSETDEAKLRLAVR